MTAAVSNAHLNGQMIITGSRVRKTAWQAIAICQVDLAQHQPIRRVVALPARILSGDRCHDEPASGEMGRLVDFEANTRPTAHINGEAS